MVTEKVSLKGKVIWFFGMCGAGKTTLADLLAKELKEKGHKVERLDGDIVRKALCKELGFSKEDVFENIRRVCYVADILSQNDITVIASFITPHKANRLYLKTKLGSRLILVHVMTSVEECIKRDPKLLWKKALNGVITNLAGLDAPFDPVDHSSGFTIDVPTSKRSVEDTYGTLIELLRFWYYEI